MSTVKLEAGHFGWDYILKHEDGRSILIQSDSEWCSVARYFGWNACECGETDGSVDCKHHKTSDMIREAGEWLDNHIGEETDDPGWFEND